MVDVNVDKHDEKENKETPKTLDSLRKRSGIRNDGLDLDDKSISDAEEKMLSVVNVC